MQVHIYIKPTGTGILLISLIDFVTIFNNADQRDHYKENRKLEWLTDMKNLLKVKTCKGHQTTQSPSRQDLVTSFQGNLNLIHKITVIYEYVKIRDKI